MKENTTPGATRATLLLLAFALFILVPARAQQAPLSATQAVAQALQANGTVQAAQRALEAQQAVRRGAVDVLGRTTIQGTYGQFNSYRHDNQISITQPLSLPGVYRSQARLADAQITARELELTQVQAELRRQVRLSYEQAVHARHRLRVLRGQDSIYTEFLRAANLRFKTGEVARLEPATALVQHGETQARLRQARTDYAVARRQLQALLQQPTAVVLADSILQPLVPAAAPADSAQLTRNPQARVLQQQVRERQAATRAEQALALPNVTLGYFNQSLIGPQTVGGVGGPERYYGGNDRFQGLTAGVALPLYRKPHNARVEAARLQEQVAQTQAQRYQAELAARIDELQARRRELEERVQFYAQTGLPQAAVIVRLSTRAFKAGEMGYSEYLLNLDRALQLRTTHLDALLAHNQTIIELEYLLGTAAQ